MKRKYICITVMVLMISALFPGMMISGDCESCSTENVTMYTSESLEESGLETTDCSSGCGTDALLTYADLQEMISSTKSDIESIRLEVELLEDKMRESVAKDFAMSAANSYIDLMNTYIEKSAKLAQLETIYAHTEETKDGLAMFVSASLTSIPTEKELAHKLNTSEAAFQQFFTMEAKLLVAENAPYIQARIPEYNALVEAYVAAHVSYLEEYYLVQMSSWGDGRLLTDSILCADKTTPLAQYTQHYLTNFAQVRVWVGNYSTSTPNINSMIDEQCYTYFTMANDYDYYWSRRVDGTQSIQIKFIHSAYKSTTRHNAIWVVNKNIYGSSTPHGYEQYTTTTPSNGYHYISTYCILVCCEQTYNVWRWCNTHCGGCFACDPTGCQNFMVTQ